MKVLIVGYGSIAKKHGKALWQIEPAAQIVALRHSHEAAPIDAVLSVYDMQEAAERGPYDFVIISNPTFKHAEAIAMTVPLNCPLFIEKPLFHEATTGALLNSVADKKTATYVACNLRFLDCLNYVKETMLPNMHINEVNIYCGSYLPEWREGIDYKRVYSAHASQGGGVHLDLIHEIDYTYWLFGKPGKVRSCKRNTSSLRIDAVDYANYLLEYEGFAVNIVLNYYRRDKKRTLELVCSNDTYIVDLFANTVSSAVTGETLFRSEQTFMDTYKLQMEYFIAHVLPGGRKREERIMNDINEAFDILQICLQ